MDRPHRPPSVPPLPSDSEESVTYTHPHAVSGSSTEITQVGPAQIPVHLSDIEYWQVGRQVGDYVLQSKLGEGGLGTVYLARQISLNRLVALKVTDAAIAGTDEGLALAGLEHEHIVKVFAGFIEPTTGKHCLCLQYVPGTTLTALIARLHAPGSKSPQTGQDLLQALDALVNAEIPFDPQALADRERLASDDFSSAVCRLGEQLAGALAFAHGRDFLHCDIKPGNILLTPYGRPMLVDFNISVNAAPSSDRAIGGTPKYMAPEQVDAFHGRSPEILDHRIDIYALGVVLHELLTGQRPSSVSEIQSDRIPRELAVVIRRCLQPNPNDRYSNAIELASALNGAREILTAQRRLPPAGWLGQLALRRPLTVLLALALIPHIVATLLNIVYNAVQIELNESQITTFTRITLTYNTLIYLLCVTWGVRLLRTFHQGRMKLLSGSISQEEAEQVRKDSLNFGYRGNFFAFLGWIPGGILFPTLLNWFDGPLPWHDRFHFVISFALSGLVGMVYSYYGIQFVILRAVYPFVRDPDTFDSKVTRQELAYGTRWLEPFLILATLIPLSGAILLIVLVDEKISIGFRLLVTSLILLGMAGVTGLVCALDRLNILKSSWMARDDRAISSTVARSSTTWRKTP